MTTTLSTLLELFDLQEIAPDRFLGGSPQTSLVRVFGGQVAGQALIAAARTVEDSRVPHSMHAYFLRPGKVGRPIEFQVDRIRSGRSFDTRKIVAEQDGRVIFDASVSFHVPEIGPDHQMPFPDVPAPETLPTITQTIEAEPDAWPEFYYEWGSVDIRYVPGVSGVRDGRRVWFKTTEAVPADSVLHAGLLACFTDLTLLSVALAPHGVPPRHDGFQLASLDHCVWFHRPVRVDEWMLYDQFSPTAALGRGIAQGHVFATDGTLVATVLQEGLLRPVPLRA
ncbi:acyl-CoA thioesterase [Nocardia sp. alder85J]|uniref:acyl-CoA thioesterase n=1 Tax=Nocardia sp. alder85J TaxID=2862949 RepID=UPI001CD5F712|nr:acyl-CoA thioesterase II [Nocardia sp. alder85J]MCX4095736.1 acyl-CoA thioesterase II [Nocardia sp. alder85J]